MRVGKFLITFIIQQLAKDLDILGANKQLIKLQVLYLPSLKLKSRTEK